MICDWSHIKNEDLLFVICTMWVIYILKKTKKQHASTFHTHDCHLLLKIIGLTRLTCYYTPQEIADHYTIWRRIPELYWVNQKLDGYPIILRKLHSERIFPCGKTVLAQLNETDLTIIHHDQGCSYRLTGDGKYNLQRQFVLCPNNNPHVKRAVFRLPYKDSQAPQGACENGSPCLFSYHYFSES